MARKDTASEISGASSGASVVRVMPAPDKEEHRTPAIGKIETRSSNLQRPTYRAFFWVLPVAVGSQPIPERLVQEIAGFPVGYKGASVEVAMVACIEARVRSGR